MRICPNICLTSTVPGAQTGQCGIFCINITYHNKATKNCTFWGKPRTIKRGQIQITALVFLPIYPTTSIMTALLQRSRSWNVWSVVWTRRWPDVRDIYSGLEPFPRALRSSDALKDQRLTEGLLLLLGCVLFWKHDLENLWETWMHICPDQIGLLPHTSTAVRLFEENLPEACGIMFYYHGLSSMNIWINRVTASPWELPWEPLILETLSVTLCSSWGHVTRAYMISQHIWRGRKLL